MSTSAISLKERAWRESKGGFCKRDRRDDSWNIRARYSKCSKIRVFEIGFVLGSSVATGEFISIDSKRPKDDFWQGRREVEAPKLLAG